MTMQETAEAASLALLVEGEDSKHFNMQRIAKLQQKSARGLKRLAKKGVSVEVGSSTSLNSHLSHVTAISRSCSHPHLWLMHAE